MTALATANGCCGRQIGMDSRYLQLEISADVVAASTSLVLGRYRAAATCGATTRTSDSLQV